MGPVPGVACNPVVAGLAAAAATTAATTRFGGRLSALGNGNAPHLWARLQHLPAKLSR